MRVYNHLNMLQLYTSDYCTYCRKVEAFLDEHSVPYEHFNVVTNEHNRRTVVERGGKLQVPFLIDTEQGVEMFESDDIMSYVQCAYLSSKRTSRTR